MIVLKIIGIVVFLLLVYGLMEKLNNYTYKKYSYEFFTLSTLGIYIAIYCGLFFGWKWYLKSDDPLNGILVIAIALAIFAFVFIQNIKKTTFKFGFFFTFVQAILYIPISVVGLIVFLCAIAFFAQAKPVYRIDD